MNDTDLISPDVSRLIQLFSALPDVKFPDVDAPMLQELISRVKEHHLAVAHAEAQLDAARRALEDEHEVLLKKAHRLHSWLSVMAEADEGLQQKLIGISLPRQRKPQAPKTEPVPSAEGGEPAPRRRGRPRKVVPASEALFAEAPAAS
jgi:hypothetical protein